MAKNQNLSTMKKSVALTFAGLLVFILYLHFSVGFSDILDVLKEVNLINYLFYYSLAVAATILSLLFHSTVWYELLKLLSVRLSLRKAFIYSWIGSFVDLVVPFETVSGEITRVYLATRNSTDHVGKIVASVASQRILSMITVLTGLIISSASLAFRYKVAPYILDLLVIVQIGIVASILLIFYFYVKKEAGARFVDSLLKLVNFILRGRLKLPDLRTRAYHALCSFYQGIEAISSQPKGLIKPVIFNFAAWISHLATYILVFYALGFKEISLDVSIAVYSISAAVQTIPIGLSVGLVEIVMASLFNLFGIPLALGGTATALIRIITFWFQIIVGYVMAHWVGIRVLTQRKTDGTQQP